VTTKTVKLKGEIKMFTKSFSYKLAVLNAELEVLKNFQNNVPPTSEEYREFLMREIEVVKQKQQLVLEEMDVVRANSSFEIDKGGNVKMTGGNLKIESKDDVANVVNIINCKLKEIDFSEFK
jgi:hypothetical protein